jgi:hypothetical protein
MSTRGANGFLDSRSLRLEVREPQLRALLREVGLPTGRKALDTFAHGSFQADTWATLEEHEPPLFDDVDRQELAAIADKVPELRRLLDTAPQILRWALIFVGDTAPLIWVGRSLQRRHFASVDHPTFARIEELAPDIARGVLLALVVAVLRDYMLAALGPDQEEQLRCVCPNYAKRELIRNLIWATVGVTHALNLEALVVHRRTGLDACDIAGALAIFSLVGLIFDGEVAVDFEIGSSDRAPPPLEALSEAICRHAPPARLLQRGRWDAPCLRAEDLVRESILTPD